MTNTPTNTDPRKDESEMNIDELFAAAEYEKYNTWQLMERANQLAMWGIIPLGKPDELQAHIDSFETPEYQTPWTRRLPTVTSS